MKNVFVNINTGEVVELSTEQQKEWDDHFIQWCADTKNYADLLLTAVVTDALAAPDIQRRIKWYLTTFALNYDDLTPNELIAHLHDERKHLRLAYAPESPHYPGKTPPDGAGQGGR